MDGTVKFGLWIALGTVMVVMAALAMARFENHVVTDDAKQRAAGCLSETPCQRLDLNGALVVAPPPLVRSSRCANPTAWGAVASLSDKFSPVLRCVDGATYLYHLGDLKEGGGSRAQWLVCRTADCAAEIAVLEPRLIRRLYRR